MPSSVSRFVEEKNKNWGKGAVAPLSSKKYTPVSLTILLSPFFFSFSSYLYSFSLHTTPQSPFTPNNTHTHPATTPKQDHLFTQSHLQPQKAHSPQWSRHYHHLRAQRVKVLPLHHLPTPTASPPLQLESDQSFSPHHPSQSPSFPKNSTSPLSPILRSIHASNNTSSASSSSSPSSPSSSTVFLSSSSLLGFEALQERATVQDW